MSATDGSRMSLFISYMLCINAVTFLIYTLDKIKAKAGAWRISEFALLLLAAAGGAAGALIAMIICRHKIRVPKFKLGIPLILTAQIAVLYFIGTGEF